MVVQSDGARGGEQQGDSDGATALSRCRCGGRPSTAADAGIKHQESDMCAGRRDEFWKARIPTSVRAIDRRDKPAAPGWTERYAD